MRTNPGVGAVYPAAQAVGWARWNLVQRQVSRPLTAVWSVRQELIDECSAGGRDPMQFRHRNAAPVALNGCGFPLGRNLVIRRRTRQRRPGRAIPGGSAPSQGARPRVSRGRPGPRRLKIVGPGDPALFAAAEMRHQSIAFIQPHDGARPRPGHDIRARGFGAWPSGSSMSFCTMAVHARQQRIMHPAAGADPDRPGANGRNSAVTRSGIPAWRNTQSMRCDRLGPRRALPFAAAGLTWQGRGRLVTGPRLGSRCLRPGWRLICASASAEETPWRQGSSPDRCFAPARRQIDGARENAGTPPSHLSCLHLPVLLFRGSCARPHRGHFAKSRPALEERGATMPVLVP